MFFSFYKKNVQHNIRYLCLQCTPSTIVLQHTCMYNMHVILRTFVCNKNKNYLNVYVIPFRKILIKIHIIGI